MPFTLKAVKEWIIQMGTEPNGQYQRIPFAEEVEEILEHNLSFPKPWSPRRSQRETPEKIDSDIGLFSTGIPVEAKQGHIVGITSGVFDILHAGHLRYPNGCRQQCHIFVVGVDGNRLVEIRKRRNPYQDFPVRLGTLSELDDINLLFQHS